MPFFSIPAVLPQLHKHTHTPHSKASAQLIMTILLISNGEYTKRILHTRETPDDTTFLSSPFIQVGLCNRHDDDHFHSCFVRLLSDVSGLINSNSNISSNSTQKLMLLLLFSLLNANATEVALIRHGPTGRARIKRRKTKHNNRIASHRIGGEYKEVSLDCNSIGN